MVPILARKSWSKSWSTYLFIYNIIYLFIPERKTSEQEITTDINILDVLGLIIRLRYWLNRCSIPDQSHITLSHKEMDTVEKNRWRKWIADSQSSIGERNAEDISDHGGCEVKRNSERPETRTVVRLWSAVSQLFPVSSRLSIKKEMGQCLPTNCI